MFGQLTPISFAEWQARSWGFVEGVFIFIEMFCNGGDCQRAPEALAPRGVWGHASSPKKFLKSRGSEMLFSAFSTKYFVKKSILIKCKMTGIFSAYRQILLARYM